MKQTRGIISLRKKIAVGYALIIVLIGGIVGTYFQEWRQLEGYVDSLTARNNTMNLNQQGLIHPLFFFQRRVKGLLPVLYGHQTVEE